METDSQIRPLCKGWRAEMDHILGLRSLVRSSTSNEDETFAGWMGSAGLGTPPDSNRAKRNDFRHRLELRNSSFMRSVITCRNMLLWPSVMKPCQLVWP